MHLQMAILYFAFLLIGILFQIKLWRKDKLSGFSIFHASFLIYYVVTPLTLAVFNNTFANLPGIFTDVVYNSDLINKINAIGFTAISYIVMLFTYFSFEKKMIRPRVSYLNKVNSDSGKDIRKSMKIVFRFGIFFLVFGGGSMVLFFMELGGFKAALRFSETLRYIGTEPADYYGPMGAIFRMLSFFIMGAAYCLKLYADSVKDKKSKILFYLSFILSIMYLLFNSGRATILLFLVPFLLEPLLRKNKNIIGTLVFLFLAVILTAQLLDKVLYQLSVGGISQLQIDSNLLMSINAALQDLTFPYANTLKWTDMNHLLGYRFGQDYFVWLIDILPTRLFSLFGISIPNFDAINVNTSAYYFYTMPNLMGGVPTDFITLGLRQLHLPGLLLNSFIFSFFALYIDRLSRSIGSKYNLISIRIKLSFFTLVANNDLSAFVRGSLFIIIIIIMLMLISKKVEHVKYNSAALENVK